MHTTTLLDCTLRDGGYYTEWEFAPAMVTDYLTACAALAVDVVELGYVRLAPGSYGPFADLPRGLTPHLPLALPPDHRMRFAVMIDAADLGDNSAEAGRLAAAKLTESTLPVDIVRLAVTYDRVRSPQVLSAIASLRDAGFEICVNLMKIDLATAAELDGCLETLRGAGPLAAVYLADSLGSMTPPRTRALVERCTGALDAAIGIHAHNNQALALANTIEAAAAGATWLDATVDGMGRGAGNTPTEDLFRALGTPTERLRPLTDLIAEHFRPLRREHRWGPSDLYALAGRHRIHPTYIQRIEATHDLEPAEKMRAVRYFIDTPATKFSTTLLDEALRHTTARTS